MLKHLNIKSCLKLFHFVALLVLEELNLALIQLSVFMPALHGHEMGVV